MQKMIAVLVMGLLTGSSMAANEIVVPVAKVDVLKLNDKAKATATEQKGIIGTAVGYVKGGIIYLWDSSVSGVKSAGEKVVEHPYISLSTIIAALMVDKNNNITGLWKDSEKAKGETATTARPITIIIDGDENDVEVRVQ